MPVKRCQFGMGSHHQPLLDLVSTCKSKPSSLQSNSPFSQMADNQMTKQFGEHILKTHLQRGYMGSMKRVM